MIYIFKPCLALDVMAVHCSHMKLPHYCCPLQTDVRVRIRELNIASFTTHPLASSPSPLPLLLLPLLLLSIVLITRTLTAFQGLSNARIHKVYYI